MSTISARPRRLPRRERITFSLSPVGWSAVAALGVALLGCSFALGWWARPSTVATEKVLAMAPALPAERASPPTSEKEVTATEIKPLPEPAPKPEPKVEPKPAPIVPVREAPRGGFGLQLGSYPNSSEAEAFIAAHGARLQGWTVYLLDSPIAGKGVWYRVRLGHYENKSDAEAAQKRLDPALLGSALVVAYK